MSADRCPFCGLAGELGVWDEDVQAYAHEACSVTATWTQIEAAKRRMGYR
jgi:hypothetical protein